MRPMKLIECRGTPEEMGLQYGEAARDEIQFARELWQEFLKKFPIKSSFEANAVEALKFFAPDSLTEVCHCPGGKCAGRIHILPQCGKYL